MKTTRLSKVARTLLTMLVVALVGGRPLARAGDAPDVVPEATDAFGKELVDALRIGRYAEAADRLDDPGRACLAASPSVAWSVAVAIAGRCEDAVRTDSGVADRLVSSVGSLVGADDAHPAAAGVRAVGELLTSVHGWLKASEVPVGQTKAAATRLLALGKKLPSVPTALDGAHRLARHVAALRSEESDAWAAFLDVAGAVRSLRTDPMEDDAFVREVATAELTYGLLIAARGREGARARGALERGIETYAARGYGAKLVAGMWHQDTKLYNRAMSVAKSLGSTTKRTWVTDDYRSSDRRLTTKTPAFAGWTRSRSDSDQDYGLLTRTRAGDTLEIQIWGYNGWTEYDMGDGTTVPGENVDGFLKKDMRLDREYLVKVLKESRATAALSPTIPAPKGYEIRGVDADGVSVRHRNWYFKHSLAARRYFNVSVTQTGAWDEKDPELLFVLNGFREGGDAER